ncbi:unnamed protein product [Darwinula stevensoni]|uniref:Uncharacterized protein n=1 Tax=Darwinula stevensoni TaxID=69355 RepID=A0A7R9FPM7_9CRUS|nr:unnamed protein product [Darwinula stevensoni]CAG0897811.1 unnamed protein product [Darwinula stevensoni]
MIRLFVLVLSLFGCALAQGRLACHSLFLAHFPDKVSTQTAAMSVTWGLNPFDPGVFDAMPLRSSDAEAEGWRRVDEAELCDGGQFRGIRYALDGDLAAILIFDQNGIIAGYQTAITVEESTANGNTFPFGEKSIFRQDVIDDVDVYALTAYFIDPGRICEGRTDEEFETEGTGTGLYLQIGEDPTDPDQGHWLQNLFEEDMPNNPEWVFGACFFSMGNHYWLNIASDMDCDDFFPVFLLFNNGKLTAFGWGIHGYYESPRFEHPPSFSLGMFLDPVPNCLVEVTDTIGVSTMHIYFNSDPLDLLC